MGMNGSLKSRQILDNAQGVLAIELIACAQALDFREFSFGKGTGAARRAIRRVVEHLEVDRPLFVDHNNMTDAVTRCDVLREVEEAVGPLRTSWGAR
jgi:histidine ammonia-lyase